MSALKNVSNNPEYHLTYQRKRDSSILAEMTGKLNVESITYSAKAITHIFKTENPEKLILECGGITYCDTIGASLFIKAQELASKNSCKLEIINLNDDFLRLINLFNPEADNVSERTPRQNIIEKLGATTTELFADITESISFVGLASVSLIESIIKPHKIRWKDVLVTAEKVGVNAIGIIALVNFLVGLVIAFQSAIPLEKYGGTIFVADLLVLSIFRELGPLMTAIVVNGRSSSAFAAEIGTMKVNEEVDALTTMGLDPSKFLVVPKIIASLIMIPVLTVFGNLFGLLGGLVVMVTLGFPPIAYLNEIQLASTYVDLLGGLFKSLFFAVTIAGVGCLEGLKTKKGPAAVGDSTTSSVVRGIVLIILLDGIFGVLYYYLGI